MSPHQRPWTGGQVTERARCVLAPNPGHMTLEGTNTWVVRAPGGDRSVVIDPGPLDEGHLAAVLAAAGPVAAVLVTHRHHDHTEGAAAFAAMASCVVRAADPEQCIGAEPLDDGEVVSVAGVGLEVVATPGHTTDSVCLLLPADRQLFTGDTVLGRGTAVVTHPDGTLATYLASLDRLRGLVASGPVTGLLPGHGPPVTDAGAVLEHYVTHRLERLEQVRAALAAGDTTAREVVASVYADIDEVLWPAAEMSVAAQLDYLERGRPAPR